LKKLKWRTEILARTNMQVYLPYAQLSTLDECFVSEESAVPAYESQQNSYASSHVYKLNHLKRED
jgi:hypothetical protein